ncbi:hypothetical protein Fmac_010634 [Flemingia macrophylla]|uniref:Uncharacterized protein n=1 Tax=Flemingia macrophylla TaxID=520843 RepID=A0ABD1MK64_9FABA
MAGVAEEHKTQPYGVSVPPKRKRERVSEASMKRRKLMLDLNEPAFPDLNKEPPPDTSSDDEDDQASSVAENESLSRLASLLVRSRRVTAMDLHSVFRATERFKEKDGARDREEEGEVERRRRRLRGGGVERAALARTTRCVVNEEFGRSGKTSLGFGAPKLMRGGA